MGRKAIPANLHRLKGTYQPVRHGSAATIGNIEPGVPECPDWLSDRAKEVWAYVGPLLDSRKTITQADAIALTLLCESFGDWKRLRAEVQTEGEVYSTTTPSGDQMRRPNPKVALRDRAEKLLRQSLIDFGLNPAARGKLTASGGGRSDNKFARLGQ